MKIIIRLFIIIVFICLSSYANAQRKKDISEPDTITVKKGSRVTFGNFSFIPDKDTILIVPDSIFFRVRFDPKIRSKIFYDSLERKAERSLFTQSIYDITFVSQRRTTEDTVLNIKSESVFLPFEGKIIRNISITRLDVFGTSVLDTTFEAESGFTRFLNKVHINSKEWVIRHNLTLNKGDIVNPIVVAENERIIRQLPYIEDALIILTNVGVDSVDAAVITKDVWSINLVPIIKSASSATFKIYDANIIGLGHKFSNKIGINTDESPIFRYKQLSYEVQNIGGSFIRGFVEYTNDPDEKAYNIILSRPFSPPIITVAGGAAYKRTLRPVTITTYGEDTISKPGTLKFDATYCWIGKTFPINLFAVEDKNKSYITLSGKYSKYIYYEYQEYNTDWKYKYENRDIALFNISISKNNYVLSNLIYSFGRTEDIPYGYNLTLTVGEKFGEYDNRFYSGLQFSYGSFSEEGRYFYTHTEYGGYIHRGSVNKGVYNLQGTIGSKLSTLFRSQLRNYATLRYLRGLNRYSYEKIYLDDKHGYRGISQNEDLSGTQRLTLNLESVLFTPIYFLGFRIAAFAYLDNGLITYDKNIFDLSNYYAGLGIGFRIRNENLIFRTFQIDFSFYPIAPEGINPALFSIKGVNNVNPKNFNPKAPNMLLFE